MEVITRERVQKSTYNVYLANDGTEFSDKEECKKYEESAQGVLMTKIKHLIVNDITEEAFWSFGSCDNTIWVIKVESQGDVDTIMQTYLLLNSFLMQNEYKDRVERARALVQRALVEKDFLFVGRGFDMDSFWFIGTLSTMKEDLDKLCIDKEVKNGAGVARADESATEEPEED